MRKTYRFSHGIAQGGFMYAHVVKEGNIQNREGLRRKLKEVETTLGLLDVTIKIYDGIFFFFFMPMSSVGHVKTIVEIQKAIPGFGDWADTYLFEGVYDLQEQYLRRDLEGLGFDYDAG